VAAKYRKTASEPAAGQKKTRLKRPEVRLAAEIAGVTYWMAYKVMRGQAVSQKVGRAIAVARERLQQQKIDHLNAARANLCSLKAKMRALKAEQKRVERSIEGGQAA